MNSAAFIMTIKALDNALTPDMYQNTETYEEAVNFLASGEKNIVAGSIQSHILGEILAKISVYKLVSQYYTKHEECISILETVEQLHEDGIIYKKLLSIITQSDKGARVIEYIPSKNSLIAEIQNAQYSIMSAVERGKHFYSEFGSKENLEAYSVSTVMSDPSVFKVDIQDVLDNYCVEEGDDEKFCHCYIVIVISGYSVFVHTKKELKMLISGKYQLASTIKHAFYNMHMKTCDERKQIDACVLLNYID